VNDSVFRKESMMSLNPSSLVSTPVNNPSVYVPLNQRNKLKIEAPEDPQDALALVEDLYNQASAPTGEQKATAPYKKIVRNDGAIVLSPNGLPHPTFVDVDGSFCETMDNNELSTSEVEGPSFLIDTNGKVQVIPREYLLPGVSGIQEQATDPKIIEEVQTLMAQAKPQEEIPERSLEVGYVKFPGGSVRILKKELDGTDKVYSIEPYGAVLLSVEKYNNAAPFGGMTNPQQIIKPGELPVLKEGEERPVGQALSEAPVEEDAPPPTNGKRLDLQA
jgi:hypothetical protein